MILYNKLFRLIVRTASLLENYNKKFRSTDPLSSLLPEGYQNKYLPKGTSKKYKRVSPDEESKVFK